MICLTFPIFGNFGKSLACMLLENTDEGNIDYLRTLRIVVKVCIRSCHNTLVNIETPHQYYFRITAYNTYI